MIMNLMEFIIAQDQLSPSTRGLSVADVLYSPIEKYKILAGATTLHHTGDPGQQIRPLSRALRHPANHELHRYDIAILYWKEPLTFGEFVQPIALPPQGTVPDYTKLVTMSGWGYTSKNPPRSRRLRAVTAPLVSNEVCNKTRQTKK